MRSSTRMPGHEVRSAVRVLMAKADNTPLIEARSASASISSCATIFRRKQPHVSRARYRNFLRQGVLIDDRQKIVGTATAPLNVRGRITGWSEQDPEHWWKAAQGGRRAAQQAKAEGDRRRRRHRPFRPAAWRDPARQGRTRCLRPAILWNDARSFAECKEIRGARAQGARYFRQYCHWRASPRPSSSG